MSDKILTPSQLRSGLEKVRDEYNGTGPVVPEPAIGEPLPTCDQVLADWYGFEAADIAEWMFEQNIKAVGA